MKKLLFVCLGNICRSPMAEAVFNQLVKDRGLEKKYICTSAGTAGYHIGELPDYRTRALCASYNLALDHKGRKLIKEDAKDFDYIVVMDKANYTDALAILGVSDTDQHRVVMMRSFQPNGADKEVPDPYYGTLNDFEEVYQILLSSCKGLLDFLEKAERTA